MSDVDDDTAVVSAERLIEIGLLSVTTGRVGLVRCSDMVVHWV